MCKVVYSLEHRSSENIEVQKTRISFLSKISPEIDETYLEHMMHKRNTASDKAQLLTPSDVTWRHVARFLANLARGNRRFG